MRGPQLRLLALAVIAALIVFAVWFTFRSTGEIVSPSELEAAIAETDVDRVPALNAPSPYVTREDTAVIEPIDEEATSTRFDPDDLVVRFIDAEGEPVSDLRAVLKVELAKHDERGVAQMNVSVLGPRGDMPRHGIRIPSKTLENAFAIARQAGAEGRAVSVTLSPAFTIPACTSYTFHALEKPAEDIELRVEGSGFVRVDALEPNGDPYAHDLDVLVMIAQSSTQSNRPDESTTPHHSQRIRAADPRVRVPLGEHLFVEVRDRRLNFHRHSEAIAGPIREGSEVLLRFTLRPYAYLVGRLISLDGEPVRDHKYYASVHVPFNGLSMSGGATDAEGRFRVKIPRDPPPKKVTKLSIHPLVSWPFAGFPAEPG